MAMSCIVIAVNANQWLAIRIILMAIKFVLVESPRRVYEVISHTEGNIPMDIQVVGVLQKYHSKPRQLDEPIYKQKSDPYCY